MIPRARLPLGKSQDQLCDLHALLLGTLTATHFVPPSAKWEEINSKEMS